MNRKQRMQNRATAAWLRHQQICPECGERGLHYVTPIFTLDKLRTGASQGFWACDKFYRPDGRRLEGV